MMQLESDELIETLVSIKDNLYQQLDRAMHNRVKALLEARIEIVETILIWLNKTKKEGEVHMEMLKIGLGKTVKLSDIKASRSKVDPAIIAEAAQLKAVGEARAIDPAAIKWTYFANRVYALRKDGKLDKSIKPLKQGASFYLVKVDEE